MRVKFVLLIVVFLAMESTLMGVAEAKKHAPAKVHRSKFGNVLHQATKKLRTMHNAPKIASHHKKAVYLEEAKEDGEEAPVEPTEDKDGDAEEGDDESKKDPKEDKDNSQWTRLYVFLIIVTLCIVACGIVAYNLTKGNQPKPEEYGVEHFMGFDVKDASLLFVGMASGFVFGLIDNGGLFFGMEYLDPLLSKLPYGDEHLVNSGYGNTFSDMVGAFMGTFVGKIIEESIKKDDPTFSLEAAPIWTGAIGITIGCLFGVAIPRLIMGPPSKKVVSAAEMEALRAGVTQEKLDAVLSEFDRIDKEVDQDLTNQVRKENLIAHASPSLRPIIENADLNGDGIIDRDEVVKQLTAAMKTVESYDSQNLSSE